MAEKYIHRILTSKSKNMSSTPPIFTGMHVYGVLGMKAKPRPSSIDCLKCHRHINNPHVYIWGFGWIHECIHVEYDGEPWCDSCVAPIVQDNGIVAIYCTNCAGLDWGAKIKGSKVRLLSRSEF